MPSVAPAVVILTYNEEANLPSALASVAGWAHEVFIVDSFSTDGTVDIARRAGCKVFQHKFVNYALQRNFALVRLPITAEWVFFLDADEWMPQELRQEISQLIASNPTENGFFVKRRLIWMGRWIRRGYYPTWILRLFRRGKARCEDRAVNEHIIVEGEVGYIRNDFIHEDRRGLAAWILKHNDYAVREARELIRKQGEQGYRELDAAFWGTQAQRKRWVRHRIWEHLPPLIRPVLYFSYRYFLRGGFLDGIPGFTYHFFQALWFPMLIDAYFLENQSEGPLIPKP